MVPGSDGRRRPSGLPLLLPGVGSVIRRPDKSIAGVGVFGLLCGLPCVG